MLHHALLVGGAQCRHLCSECRPVGDAAQRRKRGQLARQLGAQPNWWLPAVAVRHKQRLVAAAAVFNLTVGTITATAGSGPKSPPAARPHRRRLPHHRRPTLGCHLHGRDASLARRSHVQLVRSRQQRAGPQARPTAALPVPPRPHPGAGRLAACWTEPRGAGNQLHGGCSPTGEVQRRAARRSRCLGRAGAWVGIESPLRSPTGRLNARMDRCCWTTAARRARWAPPPPPGPSPRSHLLPVQAAVLSHRFLLRGALIGSISVAMLVRCSPPRLAPPPAPPPGAPPRGRAAAAPAARQRPPEAAGRAGGWAGRP